MLKYIIKRSLIAIPQFFIISIMVFIVIKLPPGDFFTQYRIQLERQGERISQEILDQLREDYGLDQPTYVQYYKWISGIVLRGDFGYSFEYDQPVANLIWARIFMTIGINVFVIVFVWLVAIPIGVFSSTHKYSFPDYVLNLLAFIGTGMPAFLLALILMWGAYYYLGADVGGLFSREFVSAPWSLAKFVDLLKHAWVAIVVLSVGRVASLIRTMRANMLDELSKPYVDTARAKGLRERDVIRKYPVRVALNPFISGLGEDFRELLSGSQTAAIVLNLPLTGPLLLAALISQDMYLAGGFILVLSIAGISGSLVSDILLAVADPRIRYE